jgi:hypothetical protein
VLIVATPSTSSRSAGAWSSPAHGLAARLLTELEDLQPGLRCAITLELKNVAFEPIAVTNQPKIHAVLRDATGSLVTSAGLLASGPDFPQQWGVIPRDACLSFRVDARNIGVTTREQKMALVATGGRGWSVRAGNYLLAATLEFEKDDSGPANQWVGTLVLPEAPIEVPASLFAAN